MIFRICTRFYIEDRFKTRLFFRLFRYFSYHFLLFLEYFTQDRSKSKFRAKNIFRKYFEKEDIPGYIYSRRRTTNKEIKRIYRGILGDIFSKRQRNILYAGKMLKIHAYPLPFFLRERTGRLPFSRVALGSGTIAVFPCNLFPFPPPQSSVSKHFVNHLSVARARAEFVSWDSDDTEALINLRHPASEEINLSNSWHAGRDKIGRINKKNI